MVKLTWQFPQRKVDTTAMLTVGVVGRFQPFHWGHYEYLLAAASLSERLSIGITNPGTDSIYTHPSDVTRSLPASNPFSFADRCEMIKRTLEAYSPHLQYQFRRCVFGSPDLLRDSFGPADLVALTLYDEWSLHRVELFREAGYRVEILWQRREKITSGSEIRERIRTGQSWNHLVPAGTAGVVETLLGRTETT
jgi:cytidyltransferase-like protein